MPYNPAEHSNVIVSKRHKALLKKYAKTKRRTMQATLEIIIEKAIKEAK
jgi:hypothetical protein